MRILIFGAGALGSAVGAMLSSMHDVTLIGRDPHISAVATDGLTVIGDRQLKTCPRAMTTFDEVCEPDILILTVKSYDTASAIAECRRFIGDDTKVLTLQNGLGNLELLRSWKGDKAFGGTTTIGAMLISPGQVRLSGLGMTVVGSDMDPEGASSIAEALSSVGIPTVISGNIIGELWAKAIVNASINPLTAILQIPNGSLLDSDVISRLMDQVCNECTAIAEAAGIDLPSRSLTARVREVVRDTSSNRSSMLKDVEMGRRTEIAQINGMMCKYASSLGVPAYLNRTLLAMVESLAVSHGERLIS